MAEPVEQPSEDEKKPEFGAIIPEQSTGDVESFLSEFDQYQRKLDQEWDKAKASYQNKVNQIMEDYLNQKFEEKDFRPPETPNESAKPASPPREKNIGDEPPFQQKIEKLLSNVESELRRSNKQRRFSWFDDFDARVINVPSRSLRSMVKKVGFIVFVTGVVGSALYSYFVFPLQLAAKTPLPYTHATGAVVQGGKIYLTDWFRKALYVHQTKRGLPMVAVENIPNNFITGMAITEKNIWTLDGLDNKLIRHSLTEEHTVLEKFPTPGNKPTGVFWDGSDLWTADNQTKMLYQHKMTDIESPFNQYQFPPMTVTAFVMDKTRVWALDGDTREVRLFRLQNPLRELRVLDLDPFLEGALPTGIALHNNDVLVTTTNPPQLLKLRGIRTRLSP